MDPTQVLIILRPPRLLNHSYYAFKDNEQEMNGGFLIGLFSSVGKNNILLACHLIGLKSSGCCWMLCSTGEGIWTRKVFLLYDALIGFLSFPSHLVAAPGTYYPPPNRQQKQHLISTINFGIPGSII